MRHGAPNFASDNPGPGAAEPDPKDPDTGRQNNQGLEGMAMTPDGKFLIAVLQSATTAGWRRFRLDPAEHAGAGL